MKSSKGFSLMETIIVIAVIGILSAIAVPSIIGHRSNAKLRDAVSMMRGNFEMARSRAIRENALVIAEVKSTGDGYKIFIDNGSGTGGVAADWEQNGAEKILCDTKLPAGVKIDLSQPIFTTNLLRSSSKTCFDGRGYNTNNGIVTLLGADGKTAKIDMNNRFGRITTTYN